MPTWLEQFSRDLQFGLRGLIRTPAFTALAVMSLALGIMATTAIYSVLHAVVLDPFPYRDVDRLMSVRVSSPATRGGRISYSIDQFLDIAERNSIFEGTIASTISDVLWTGEGDPQRLRGNHGTFNTFDVMGVDPLIGRTPTADDSEPGAEPVVVLTVFSVMGLGLAVVGVYSVMSAAVAQERQEIGVRLALGADGAAIARMVSDADRVCS